MEKHSQAGARFKGRFRFSALSLALGLLSPALHAEDYFNPAALEIQDPAQQPVDLSRFVEAGGQMPGVYRVDIYLNGNRVDTRNVTFVLLNNKLHPELTAQQLVDMGVKQQAFTALAQLPPDGTLSDIGKYIPDAGSDFNFSQQRLDISIPQAALNTEARGYVDPALWDQGMPAALLNYTFSGSSTQRDGQSGTENDYYLNLRSGVNLGAWRLRNYSTYTDSASGGQHWNTINTYLQRDVQALKGQLTLGESSTPGDVFDSTQFSGLQLASDDTMLPDSLKGFAPVVRGIAQSNAQVTIRQSGNIIYQSYVPPGAFAISDLYPTSSSGDLDVTVREADGSERHFAQPFSAVPIMQREGRLKYAMTAGKYRSTLSGSRKPGFGQTSLIYGLPYDTTVYGGVLGADNYRALTLGLGHGFGEWGSVSADATQANTTLRDNTGRQGQSYRIQYAKDIAASGTTFTLAGYRYSTQGYYTFQEANEMGLSSEDNWGLNYNKRTKAQLNLSQSLKEFGSIYISAYQQNYWGLSGYERTASTGYNLSLNGISYSLSYAYTQAPGNNANDQQFAFSLQVPLSKWLPNSWASYSVNNDKRGNTSQQAGISGTALADNNLSYSVQQSYSNHGGGNSGSASANYKGTYGEASAGYNYNDGSRQMNYGLQGGIVVHPYGVTLSQQLGETVALVRAPGADNLKVENNTGVYTDWRGYAVVPYTSTYRKNRIALDTQSMGDDVDIETNTQTVIPTKGAIVLANFTTRVGSRVLFTLHYQDKPLPFGATVSLVQADPATPNAGIVGDSGQAYLSGVPQQGQLQAQWGEAADQQCQVSFTLPEQAEGAMRSVDAACR
ncbi:fimbria/pilus outer membrane usher protein [Serratia quinivorans]|uniref:fimbria/pilus outer membrane usher protein n=1 Tax=Serratia quinivorans TaxID=137545 RepID=UPI001C4976A6|nr:fimbria/pilus outer membrane usher protein [Serratia quinivorans]MBV6694002.1 fimbrial biogenesis outer membrane usher protein [Serratia quinivorans]